MNGVREQFHLKLEVESESKLARTMLDDSKSQPSGGGMEPLSDSYFEAVPAE